MCLAGKLKPGIILHSLVSQGLFVSLSMRNFLHSSSNSGPDALSIAPSIPPPPSKFLLATLTIQSIFNLVISPRHRDILEFSAMSGLYRALELKRSLKNIEFEDSICIKWEA